MLILYDNEGRIIYAFDDIMDINDVNFPQNLKPLIVSRNIPNIYDYCVIDNELVPKMKVKINYDPQESILKMKFVGGFSIKKVQLVIGHTPTTGQKVNLSVKNNELELEIEKDKQRKWIITIDDPLIEYKEVIII